MDYNKDNTLSYVYANNYLHIAETTGYYNIVKNQINKT